MAMTLVALARYRGFTLTVVDTFNHPILSNMADMADMVQALDHEVGLLKEETQDANTFDYKAHSLSTLQHLSHEAMPICVDKIEQIYRCTGMQEMFLYRSEAWSGTHFMQWIFSLDAGVDILTLGKAIDRCVVRYPTMRTRILRNVQTGQLVQVVLRKGNEAPWSVFFSKNVDSAMKEKRQCHWMHSGLGEPLQRISLVQNSSGPTHLIWSLNHAAYDAWSFGMMLRSISQYYANPEDDPETSLPFSGFIRHVTKARNAGSKSRSFWQTYLSDMGPQALLFNYSSFNDPRQDCLAVYRVSFPKREGKTPTSLIAAAWILLLARLTHRIDITIAYLATGRTLPLGGIETCPGQLISNLPLHVRLPTESTGICNAADIVRTEMVRVMPHEHTGLDAMQSLTSQDGEATPLHAASLLGHLPFDLAIHPAGPTDFGGAKGTSMAYAEQRVVIPPPGTFSAECSIVSEKDNFEVDLAMIWDFRAVDKKGVDDIIGTWREIITDDA